MPDLKYLYSKKADETYSINWYDGPQIIKDEGYVFKSEELTGLVDISSFTDETFNETKTHYFKKYIKFNIDGKESDLIDVDDVILSGLTFGCDGEIIGFSNDTVKVSGGTDGNGGDEVGISGLGPEHKTHFVSGLGENCNIPINPEAKIIISIFYKPVIDGPNISENLEVNNIKIGGEYILNSTDEVAVLPDAGGEIIKGNKDIYKIFDLSDFILVSNHDNADIKYRFTQDKGRTHTEWLPLTKENIASTKLNPLRFAEVEFLIKNLGSPLVVYDIILVGDFQNVSANYLKTNRYGLKEDCVTGMLSGGCGLNGFNLPGGGNGNGGNDLNYLTSCSSYNDNAANELDKENLENSGSYWNPYDTKKITDIANMLGNQVSEIFGWDVDYHLVEPDGNGIDMIAHEYTLKNVVDVKKMKVIVPDNKFPVESILINQFNLDMFETFQIHIMKDEFKNKFGISRRPSQDDIIYICQANMLYYVKHAQAFKDVMNAATYYKVILEKYEYKTNIRNTLAESRDLLDELTNNTTFEETIGEDIKAEQDKIANKIQTKPTTMDYIRYKISKKVIFEKETLLIDSFEPVTSIYDLSDNTIKGKMAIDYKKSDSLIKSDNRSFMFWFKFNNSYDSDTGRISNKIFNGYAVPGNTEFNFLNNYDSTNHLGYDISYKNDSMFIMINGNQYQLEEKLLTNIWYIGVVNLNQRQHKLDMNIYTRDADINIVYVDPISYQRTMALLTDTQKQQELISQGYKPVSNLQNDGSENINLVNSISYEIEPIEFTAPSKLRLLGSNMKYSNMRIFNDVIPELTIPNIIKENIVKESQHLIIADNATKKIIATNFYNKNWQ